MYVSKLNPFKILQDVEKVNIQLDSTYSKTKILKLFTEQSKVSTSKTIVILNVITSQKIASKLTAETIQYVKSKLPFEIILNWDMLSKNDLEKVQQRIIQVETIAQLKSQFDKTHVETITYKSAKTVPTFKTVPYTTSPINIRSLLFKEVAKYDEIQSGLIPITDPNKMTLDVAFQRNLVWTLEQKQSLILSILQQMPIGMFYINESFDNPNIDVVLYDGKQRFDAIKGFLYGEFPITINNQDYYWYDLKDDDIATILSTSISINTTNFDSEVDLINYYLLINQAGRSHTEGDIQIALDELERLKTNENND